MDERTGQVVAVLVYKAFHVLCFKGKMLQGNVMRFCFTLLKLILPTITSVILR